MIFGGCEQQESIRENTHVLDTQPGNDFIITETLTRILSLKNEFGAKHFYGENN